MSESPYDPSMPRSLAMARATTTATLRRGKFTQESLQLGLWSVVLILVPFYVFKSGYPQPDDMLLAVLIALALSNRRIRFPSRSRPVVQSLAWFVWYVTVINLIWAFLLEELMVAYISTFYIFNLLAFATFIAMYSVSREKLLRVTMYAIAISVFLQIVLAVVFPSSSFRASVFFNNPNQLAHYALACGSVYFVGATYFRMSMKLHLVVFIAIFYLVAISLSKAGMAATLALGAIVFIKRPMIGMVAAAVIMVGVFGTNEGAEVLDRIVQRVSRVQGDDTLAGRGYDRIAKNPQYLVFGAGEGMPERFEGALEGHEMHSSFGTVLFSYGLVGMLLFLIFLLRLYLRVDFIAVVYSTPLLLYSLSHQGLRTTMFWVFLAYTLCISIDRRYKTARNRGAVPTGRGALPISS